MSSEVTERARDRLERIAEMKADITCYRIVYDRIAQRLERDEQLYNLILLSEEARRLVEMRESQIGYDDPVCSTVVEIGEALDEQIHRRANEIVAKVCASYVRQDDRWLVDDPDSVDTTEIQTAMDAIHESIRWLNEHEEIVQRLNITYPENK